LTVDCVDDGGLGCIDIDDEGKMASRL